MKLRPEMEDNALTFLCGSYWMWGKKIFLAYSGTWKAKIRVRAHKVRVSIMGDHIDK